MAVNPLPIIGKLLDVFKLWLDPKARRERFKLNLDARSKKAIETAEETYRLLFENDFKHRRPAFLRFVENRIKLTHEEKNLWRYYIDRLERQKFIFFRNNQ